MQDENHIAIIIVFSCLAMCIFAWAIILFVVFLRKRTIEKGKLIEKMELEKKILIFKAAASAEEREKERIARNLHDEVNIMLAIHKQTLEKHGLDINNNEFDPDAYNESVASIEKIREAVMSCASDLVPAFFLKNGLIITLEDHLRQISYAGKIVARFHSTITEDSPQKFSKQDELNIYRICLEIMNNLLKHAQPTTLKMTLSTERNNLIIQVEHDGRKITNGEIIEYSQSKQGLGLKSIKARSLLLNASVEYSNIPNTPAILNKIPFNYKSN